MGWGATELQFALDSALREENCFHFLFFLGEQKHQTGNSVALEKDQPLVL